VFFRGQEAGNTAFRCSAEHSAAIIPRLGLGEGAPERTTQQRGRCTRTRNPPRGSAFLRLPRPAVVRHTIGGQGVYAPTGTYHHRAD
jgi:hypothetical protein